MINKGNLYGLIKGLTPPYVFSAIKNSRAYPGIKAFADQTLRRDSFIPQWRKISGGLLKGRNVYLPIGAWQDMASGDYDKFFIEYLEKLDLGGKVVYDIGAHFGYSSMCFAQLVGPKGKVIAFEPNLFNQERFELIMSKNKDLSEVVELQKVAVANVAGEEDFIFSDGVDSGTSSGSFIEGADTFFEKATYEGSLGFKRVKVRTVPLDEIGRLGVKEKPYLMKIDVEGAESLVLEGARKLLAEQHPILLMEIHSIYNMLRVGEILRDLGYEMELLKEENDGRCFIAAK